MFGSMATLYYRFPKGFKKALQHHYFGFTGLVCGSAMDLKKPSWVLYRKLLWGVSHLRIPDLCVETPTSTQYKDFKFDVVNP